MPKSLTDGVTLNAKGMSVKLAMDNLSPEEVAGLVWLLRHSDVATPLTRLQTLHWLREQLEHRKEKK